MTPIISPLTFYLMSLVNNLIDFFIVVSIVSIASCFIYVFICCEEGYIIKKSIVAILGTTFVISVLLYIFIPSENTITKMLIAQNVTYERVEVATDTVQSVYEDIMALFDKEDNT